MDVPLLVHTEMSEICPISGPERTGTRRRELEAEYPVPRNQDNAEHGGANEINRVERTGGAPPVAGRFFAGGGARKGADVRKLLRADLGRILSPRRHLGIRRAGTGVKSRREANGSE